ncbi:butyrophilin subfamily 1 member A1-like [Polypterus senegalus]|uniref:butyrophilin subfamily 1 member A1-like n=1 Tax=Polypterus senegalus TaxID=55291 RepID=UPI0019647EF5|nr:butyrophilin subfamily 1 member A1-like [Polypterus senegalus]
MAVSGSPDMTRRLSRNFIAGFLLILPVTFSQENKFELVGSDTPITGKLGQTVVLPCQLKPNISAKAMEITWLTDDDKTTVFHYKAGAIQEVSEQYKDRTFLLLDKLPSGNVSLLLMNLRVSDENKYKCFVFEKDWFNDIVVQLTISNLGDRPQLSLANKDGGVTLKCDSQGWYPKPLLQWRSIAGKSLPGDVEALESPNGLITMSSQIVIPDDNSGVVCSIQDGPSRKIYKSQVYINGGTVSRTFSRHDRMTKSQDIGSVIQAMAAKIQALKVQMGKQWTQLAKAEEWVHILVPFLKGLTQQAYYNLDEHAASNYDQLMAEVLLQYAINLDQ